MEYCIKKQTRQVTLPSVILGFLTFQEALKTRQMSKQQKEYVRMRIQWSHKKRPMYFDFSDSIPDRASLIKSATVLNMLTELHIELDDPNQIRPLIDFILVASEVTTYGIDKLPRTLAVHLTFTRLTLRQFFLPNKKSFQTFLDALFLQDHVSFEVCRLKEAKFSDDKNYSRFLQDVTMVELESISTSPYSLKHQCEF